MTAESDDIRLEAARSGDLEALAGLFREHHRAALGYAISLAGPVRAPDLVSEAFVRISALMKDGRGPQDAFRPYLIRTIRSVHVDYIRRGGREIPVEDVHEALGEPSSDDGADLRFERNAIVKAFASLPERWQSVLWFTAVEGVPLTDVAERLGIQPNAVAALGFRAREGLRLAYLREHLGRTSDPACVEVSELLPRYVRGTLPARQSELVRTHLDRCDDCADTTRVLGLVNVDLAAVLLPAVIGLKLWFSVVPGGPIKLAAATSAPGTAATGAAVSGSGASGVPVRSGPTKAGGRLLSPARALTTAAMVAVAGFAALSSPGIAEPAGRPSAADELVTSVWEVTSADERPILSRPEPKRRAGTASVPPTRLTPGTSTAPTRRHQPQGGPRGGSQGGAPGDSRNGGGAGGGQQTQPGNNPSGQGTGRQHTNRGHHYGQRADKPGRGDGAGRKNKDESDRWSHHHRSHHRHRHGADRHR